MRCEMWWVMGMGWARSGRCCNINALSKAWRVAGIDIGIDIDTLLYSYSYS